jgi:hypothetical protein
MDVEGGITKYYMTCRNSTWGEGDVLFLFFSYYGIDILDFLPHQPLSIGVGIRASRKDSMYSPSK